MLLLSKGVGECNWYLKEMSRKAVAVGSFPSLINGGKRTEEQQHCLVEITLVLDGHEGPGVAN